MSAVLTTALAAAMALARNIINKQEMKTMTVVINNIDMQTGDYIPSPACKAVRQSDEMFCTYCDLRWSLDGTSKPKCIKNYHQLTVDDKIRFLKAIILQIAEPNGYRQRCCTPPIRPNGLGWYQGDCVLVKIGVVDSND